MKTHHIKSIALAITAAVAISNNSFAGTAKEMPKWPQSTGYTKTIHVGPKGYTSVVYTRKMTGGSPSLAVKDTPKSTLAIANGYESVEI